MSHGLISLLQDAKNKCCAAIVGGPEKKKEEWGWVNFSERGLIHRGGGLLSGTWKK